MTNHCWEAGARPAMPEGRGGTPPSEFLSHKARYEFLTAPFALEEVPASVKISRRSAVDVSLLVLVNAMWAAQYSAYKLASEKMGPVTVSASTFLFASLVLLPFLARE